MKRRAEAQVRGVLGHRQWGGAADVAAGGQRGPLRRGRDGRVAATPFGAGDLFGVRDALEIGENLAGCGRSFVRDIDVLAGSALGGDQSGDLLRSGTPVVTGVSAVAHRSSCSSR